MGGRAPFPAVSSLFSGLSLVPLSIFGSLDVFRLQGGYVGQVLAPWGGMDEGKETQDREVGRSWGEESAREKDQGHPSEL